MQKGEVMFACCPYSSGYIRACVHGRVTDVVIARRTRHAHMLARTHAHLWQVRMRLESEQRDILADIEKKALGTGSGAGAGAGVTAAAGASDAAAAAALAASDALKEQGNAAMKAEQFARAVALYTQVVGRAGSWVGAIMTH